MTLANASFQNTFCSTLSLQAGEDLFATATRTDVYLLLEYNDPWGAKAFEESELPESIKAHLSAALESLPYAKILLIRSRPGIREPGTSFFIARVTENDPILYAFQLEDYQDLLSLDPLEVLSGSQAYASYRAKEPLFLVCTNGRRDACCAKLGLPVYAEMSKTGADSVWQCTHLGGHRFAGNLLCFPHGILYGRMRPGDAGRILKTYRRGEIELEHYRGRACYEESVQAADYYLRRETNCLGLDDFRLIEAREISPDQWEVQFESRQNGKIHRLSLSAERSEARIYTSCKPDKLSSPVHYRLIEYKA